MRDAIEPSEIFRPRDEAKEKKASPPSPQTRFLARFFDYALFFLFLFWIHHLLGKTFPLNSFDHIIPIEYFSWIPVEAFLLSLFGTTPGKFLLKVRMKHGGKKPDFQSALKRSFNVWFRGLGMGIPIINILCMLMASNKLRVLRITSWDREDNFKISHGSVARWRFILAILIIFLGFFAFYSGKYGLFHGS